MDYLSREVYLELDDVCELLSITKATANNWIKNNTLKPVEAAGFKNIFLKKEVETLLADIKLGKNTRLKSRRNKTHISGGYIPKTYIQCKEGMEVVGKIISCLNVMNISEGYERVILAEYALKLFASRNMLSIKHNPLIYNDGWISGSLLPYYLEDPLSAGKYSILIDDILRDVKELDAQVKQLLPALSFCVGYTEEQDFLGLLYMSLQNLGDRKSKGVYYTPLTVVKDAVEWLKPFLHDDIKLLDPCCGTGNFLMYAYKYLKSLEGLHGYDISSLSVGLTRINMALVAKTEDIGLLYKNFFCTNPLLNQVDKKFDVIIGNPPWGGNISNAEREELKKHYVSAQAASVESFSVFAEYALKAVVDKGLVSFILPQSLLQVKIHQPIRSFLVDNCKIKRIRYWDNAFDGVQCPAMTLVYERTLEGFSLKGTEIESQQRSFTIKKERTMDIYNWTLDLNDDEVSLLEKIRSSVPVTFLKGKGDFGLGIVTGDNKKFLSYKNVDNNVVDHIDSLEPIYRGSDIFKYRSLKPQSRIKFTPHLFQQVAPKELYRAREKLIYRFIGGNLVFAYDNTQSLTLNSANIVIPQIIGMDIKYVLAVLNSRIAQYYFSRQYKSLKILRSQVESIPIPLVSANTQTTIIDNVDLILGSTDPEEILHLYNAIDESIKQSFGLGEQDYDFIKQELKDRNLLLYNGRSC